MHKNSFFHKKIELLHSIPILSLFVNIDFDGQKILKQQNESKSVETTAN
ncbi:hypothetical protein LEP1GSC082_1978 [Leptospira kirschneri str. H2]|uniref:Uncharacterized protein n=1 Tax=Leptospira kirschneri str. H1 TaxID=1049966 RepID=A0A0E2AX57_9LEPT|nr:hypothetical protein LEP1GSC081_0223 [Leptospira kirschneri str. H1]EKO58578.1 hypothetical protein LEP1GSC082_1978 [Leptospira kirschneri str. H2]